MKVIIRKIRSNHTDLKTSMCVSSVSFQWCPQPGSVIKPSVAWLLLFFGCPAKPQPGRADRAIPQACDESVRDLGAQTQNSAAILVSSLRRSVNLATSLTSVFFTSVASAVQIWSDPLAQRLTSLLPQRKRSLGREAFIEDSTKKRI